MYGDCSNDIQDNPYIKKRYILCSCWDHGAMLCYYSDHSTWLTRTSSICVVHGASSLWVMSGTCTGEFAGMCGASSWCLFTLVPPRMAPDKTPLPPSPQQHHGAHRRQRGHCRRARRELVVQGAVAVAQESSAQEEARAEHRPRRPRQGGRGAAEGEQREPQEGEWARRERAAAKNQGLTDGRSLPLSPPSSRFCRPTPKTRGSARKRAASRQVRRNQRLHTRTESDPRP